MQSQALVYKPVNPAFGEIHYQWLMSSAENQNKHSKKYIRN
jgi:hypothetical protein